MKRTLTRCDGDTFEVVDYRHITDRRARHLLTSLAVKRKTLADAYRYMRATLPPEKRAEMRAKYNESRRARNGWASV